MKKILALLLTLCLFTLTPFCPVRAESYAPQFDFYLSRYGNIMFTMGQTPKLSWDQDLLENEHYDELPLFFGWKNKIQLHYSDSNGEWQYHLADVSLMMEQIRTAHPEASEQEIARLTISNFMDLCRTISGFSCGTTPLGEVRWKEYSFDKTVMYGAEAYFEYGDLPGVTYQSTGILDGTRAVVLMGTKNQRYDAMLEHFGPITPQNEALLKMRSQPETITIGSITLTLPKQGEAATINGVDLYECFTPSFNTISLKYSPSDMTNLFSSDRSLEEQFLEHARSNGEKMVADEVATKTEASVFAPNIVLLTVYGYDTISAPWIYNYFYTPDGIYLLSFRDMDDGWDVLESVSFEIKAPNTITEEIP